MLIDTSSINLTSFSFHFTTSSGDRIDLEMSDSLKATSSYKKNSDTTVKEISLEHAFEYKFHYEGNGLSEQDKKEIKEAFKKIKPMLEKFLKQKDTNEKTMTNFSQMLKSSLPLPKNDNHLNAIKNEGVKTFDDVLNEIKASFDELKKAKELFDKLFSKNFEFYV
ncbi:ATP/GTP-binding protein [Caminibacter pacificus]|jgi:hypothetical protein